MFVLTLEGILIKWRGQELTLRNSTSQRDSWQLKHETIWRQSPESLPPSFLFIRQENLMFFWWSFYHPMVKTCLTTACWARSRANAQGKHHSQSRPFDNNQINKAFKESSTQSFSEMFLYETFADEDASLGYDKMSRGNKEKHRPPC